ncbi:hypothetical protein ES703_59201 [subsurface metagenome]
MDLNITVTIIDILYQVYEVRRKMFFAGQAEERCACIEAREHNLSGDLFAALEFHTSDLPLVY